MVDLVELRQGPCDNGGTWDDNECRMRGKCREAATEIESLRAERDRLIAALTWTMEYLPIYDHVGTGSCKWGGHGSEKSWRNWEEKLETIRLMLGLPRENKMVLGEHFARALEQSPRTDQTK